MGRLIVGLVLLTSTIGIVLAAVLPNNWANANEAPAPIGQLDPTAPSLPENAKDIDKLGFAASSLWWARATHPEKSFQPDPSGKLTPVEWQLVEALSALDTVPDSAADQAARAQSFRRTTIAWTVLREGLKKLDIKEAKKEAWKALLEPTVAGDGQGPTRDALKGWIVSTLYAYRVKGVASNDLLSDLVKKATEPDGPKLTAVPRGANTKTIVENLQSAEKVRRDLMQESDRVASARSKRVEESEKRIPDAQRQFDGYTNYLRNSGGPGRSGGASPPLLILRPGTRRSYDFWMMFQ